MLKISCIIPAYNEGPRIENVLRAVHRHPLISEVMVVDDGSKEGLEDLVRKFPGIRLIVQKKNMGKSMAVATGIGQSSGDLIVLLDADLIGLTPEAVSDLIRPVLSGAAEVSISLRKNAPWLWRFIGLDFISGERVFLKKLIGSRLTEVQNLPRFGLESFLNKLIIKNKCRIKIIYWKDVISPWKRKKAGFWLGLKGDLLMIMDIIKTLSLFGVLDQIIKLSFLKV